MTRAVTHDDAFASLEAVALGALTADEERDILAHAATCAECGPALAALRDAAARLAHAAPAAGMDAARRAELRARLLRRAKADKEVSIIAPLASGAMPRLEPRGQPRRGPANPAWLAIAAGIAFVASTALLAATWLDRVRLRRSLDTVTTNQAALEMRLDSLNTALAENQRVLQSISGPRVRVFSLAAAGPQSPLGKMFWDQATSRWTLFAHFLPAPRQGRTYQLWLISRGTRISAGTFQPDANGAAMVRAEYPLPANALDAIAVTDEPAGGVAQPTGPIVLAGSAVGSR